MAYPHIGGIRECPDDLDERVVKLLRSATGVDPAQGKGIVLRVVSFIRRGTGAAFSRAG